MSFSIRAARVEDGPCLQEIELATHEQFREIGLDEVADDETTDSLEMLAEYAIGKRSWVAAGDDDVPIGYLLVDVVDGAGHVAQVSVRPTSQGVGVGRALIDRAKAWAVEDGRGALTLTTFSEVPWNRPLYEHLGFRVLDPGDIGPELGAVQVDEARRGFGPEGRVAMRLELDSPSC
ncbi:MAG TPA: GNAT family N-acetyltransferase [Acidimicrobiales bacterium]|nr:GNAT family N-acetyltransferase [Acidimicrobiales bacterium]